MRTAVPALAGGRGGSLARPLARWALAALSGLALVVGVTLVGVSARSASADIVSAAPTSSIDLGDAPGGAGEPCEERDADESDDDDRSDSEDVAFRAEAPALRSNGHLGGGGATQGDRHSRRGDRAGHRSLLERPPYV